MRDLAPRPSAVSAYLAVLSGFGLAAVAHRDARAETATSYGWVVGGGADGPLLARQQIAEPSSLAASGFAASRTIYLNRTGGLLTPGSNDSRANTSTIVKSSSQVKGWTPSDADWKATAACMNEIWSRFDVTITEVDPGNTPHIEAMFTRSPAEVGITDNIGGISPFTSTCGVIENSIVFTFTDNLPKKPRVICEVMAQEIAHSYGLDHELLASDPMTYLSYSGNREFQDQTASCGETKDKPRACGINGSTCRADQNSVQILLARVGAAGRDHSPPSVAITAPVDSAEVEAGFEISATATDNIAVQTVEFYVDGKLVATKTAAPYELSTDPELRAGTHKIMVQAVDSDGNTATLERQVTVTGESAALGCAAGRGTPGAWLAIALGAGFAVRRRRR